MKNNLKKYNLTEAKVGKAITDLKELFIGFDLNDNNSVIFKSCIERVEDEIKSLNNRNKRMATERNKLVKEVNDYKSFEDYALEKLTKKQIIEYYKRK